MSWDVSVLGDLEVEALVPAVVEVVLCLRLEPLDLHHLRAQPLPHGLVLLVAPDLGHDVRLRPVLHLQPGHVAEQLVRRHYLRYNNKKE